MHTTVASTVGQSLTRAQSLNCDGPLQWTGAMMILSEILLPNKFAQPGGAARFCPDGLVFSNVNVALVE